MTPIIALLLALVMVKQSTGLEEIPEFLHVCPADHPNLEQCLLDSIRYLAPAFETGYAPMDLPSLNPLTVDDFKLSPKSTGLLITIKDMRIYNAHNFTTTNLKIIEHGRRYEYDLYFPYFFTNGTYYIKGQLLMFRLDGHGTSQGEYYGINTKVKLSIDHLPNANGELAPHMTKLEIKSKVKNGKIRMDNLFKGDQLLGDAVNEAVNANFHVISSDMMPLIDKRLSQILRDYTNKLFAHFTTEQLFPKLIQS